MVMAMNRLARLLEGAQQVGNICPRCERHLYATGPGRGLLVCPAGDYEQRLKLPRVGPA